MKKRNPRAVRSATVSAAAIVIAHAATAMASVSYRPVALTGTDGPLGPGMGAGVFFSDLSSASNSMNSSGQVAFRGATSQTGDPAGVWLHNGASNGTVAFAGDPMPDGGVYPNTGFNSPSINAAGQLSWRQGTNSLFSNSTGAPGLIMRTTGTAPDTGDATFGSISFPAPLLNSEGHTAFIGGLTVGTGNPPVTFTAPNANASGIWSGQAGSVSLALRQNDSVTDLAADNSIRVGSFTSSALAFSSGGKFLSLNSLQGSVTTGTTAGNDQAILSNRSGSLATIARRGDQAPGAPAGEFYRSFGSKTGINNAGQVVYYSSLRNAAGTQVTSGALFTDNGGSLTMVARGDTAMPTITNANPGEFDGVNWGGFFSDTVINSGGTVAFKMSGLNGAGVSVGINDSGLFTYNAAGEFSKAMRGGDVAPVGLADDGTAITFAGFQGGLSLNAAGQVAFTTSLRGFGVNGAIGNNLALFATDLDGSVQLIARRGTDFEVAPGDIRLITSLGGVSVTGGQDGQAISFTDSGDLSFSLGFADGTSGVFVAHVPTPAGLAVLGLGGLLAARRRR